MNDIICPNCKKVFKVDQAGFAEILRQVRDHQFEEEISKRLQIAEAEKQNAVRLAEANLKNTLMAELANKEREIVELKARTERDFAQTLAQKDAELAELRARHEFENSERLARKEKEIADLKARLEQASIEKKLSVTEALRDIEKERDNLMNELRMRDAQAQLRERSLVEKFQEQLKTKDDIIRFKDEEIALRKDMKLRLSTKMIGETLEQHCESEFNKLRATAFQNAYFEKDNDARSGSKGDFIYREHDEAGNEIISIMFEMKVTRQPPKNATRISLRNSTATAMRKNVNTPCWYRSWKPKANSITAALSTYHTNTQKCMWFVRSSLSLLSRSCETRR
jgi:hypothetical protein